MIDFLVWLVTLFLLGIVNFPLSYTLLNHLKDRGYAVTKVLGLLLWGYLFWLLTTLGMTGNNLGGVLFALFAVLALNVWLYMRQKQSIHQWVKKNIKTILLTEAVFLVAFGAWAVVRAADPAIIGTEKPMELAFINAILKSPAFPPNDPWLSGYSISYYYFGYVIVSMLVRVTGVSSTVAFNLMVALLFGLVATSAFGLLNNLLAKKQDQDGQKPLSQLWGILASFFILVMGNVQGFVEMLHARGIGWTQLPDGSWTSKFWTWLEMPEVENPPALPFSWSPNRPNGYWWWRASRVIQDFKATGERIEVIDEFPQFTYLLADMHPHVLAMPFVILAVTIALNIYLGAVKNASEKISVFEWLQRHVFVNDTAKVKFSDTFIYQWLKEPVFWLFVLVSGGIAFFNTWDFPIYVGLFALAVLVFNTKAFGWSKKRVTEFLETGMLTGILGILLYLPFFLSFASQAGGLLPSLNFFTRGVYFWIMFGTLLVPMLIWLFWLAAKRKQVFHRQVAGWGAAGLMFGLWIFSYLIAASFLILVPSLYSERLSAIASQFYWLQGGVDSVSMLAGSLTERIQWPMTWITIFIGLYLVWGVLFDRPAKSGENAPPEHKNAVDVDRFVVIMALLGFGLTLVPEFVYLLDQFGTRMNTIFKFYFQTWILWSIVAAYGTVMIWRKMKNLTGGLAKFASIMMILVGLAYPVFGIWKIAHGFAPKVYDETGTLVPDWNLDGALYRERYNPDEMAAILWLKEKPTGVVAEAVGGAYSDYARVSTYSGQPTVLGWANHESQWRGGYDEIGSRESDIEMLYRSGLWDRVQAVLEEYDITYVYFGDLEVDKYNANTNVFDVYLTQLFVSGNTVVYGYTPEE